MHIFLNCRIARAFTILSFMASDENRLWLHMVRKVKTLTDGLGMPVDPGIVETVAILRLFGFITTMSCWGHLDRITGGPYVKIVSPEAKECEHKRKDIGDFTDPLYKQYELQAREANTKERQKLYMLLDAFYDKHTSQNAQHIIVGSRSLSSSDLYCQSADLAYMLDRTTRTALLTSNRQEMWAFTEYLKAIYFKKETPLVLQRKL